MRISFILNDERFVLDLSPEMLLVDLLRKEFSIKSVHTGCGKGICGACLALVNNVATPTCLLPVFACRDTHIETIEGFSSSPDFLDIERAFIKHNLSPCAYCAPGKVLLAESLLRGDQEPSRDLVQASIPVHWCPCTDRDAFAEAVLSGHEIRRKRVKHGQR